MTDCPDCGYKLRIDGVCPWCDEETVILEQYDELAGTEFEAPYPKPDSDFMKKVEHQKEDIKNRKLEIGLMRNEFRR